MTVFETRGTRAGTHETTRAWSQNPTVRSTDLQKAPWSQNCNLHAVRLDNQLMQKLTNNRQGVKL